jgi:acyl-homoserine-lactone acylase
MKNRNLITHKLTILFTASFFFSCSPKPPTEAGTGDEVEIQWTSHGIPHIQADSWEGIGYGFAHAVATNTICVLAREFVTVRGEQSKYFGASEASINSDAFHLAMLHEAKIDEYLEASSIDNRELDKGYVRGYNNFIKTRAGSLPLSCNDAPWITPISERDMVKLNIGVGIRYGLGRVLNGIASARPGLELASLSPIDPFVDPEIIGSNAIGFGRDLTENGRGILIGNPHYPWHGSSRFHISHITLPGSVDVMGASLIATNRIAIGFTKDIAWTHTVSTALRFTMFRLDLEEGNPMRYRLGQETLDIEPIEVSVETEQGLLNKTIYMTHLGPVVVSDTTPWNDNHAYVMRDVNYENYRSGDQYMGISKAANVSELREALATHQGAAFVNTIAVDTAGDALYADMSAIPNVSAELLSRCSVDNETPSRMITLNGSEPTCDWAIDSSAAAPGLMPPTRQPSLIASDYVNNSNDSHWLSNPNKPLEGFSPIIGDEEKIRSLRTRAGLNFISEALESEGKITPKIARGILFNHRNYGAEIFLDDILSVCETDTQLSEACGILNNWDRRQDSESVGAVIYNRFWDSARNINAHFANQFSLDDPLHTPSGLSVAQEETKEFVLDALREAVDSLNEANIPLDSKWGDVQFVMRNNEKIGIPGGSGRQGMFSVITARFNPDAGGYNPIAHGNSYIQNVTWDDSGTPMAKAILTYSQSPEPDSEFYSDLTKLYSKNQWVDLPFTEEEINSDLVRKEVLKF